MKKIISSLLVCTALVSSAVYAQSGPDNRGGPGGGGNSGGPGGHGGGMGHAGPSDGGGRGGQMGGPGGRGGPGGSGPMHGGPGMHADRGGPGPGGDWHRRGGRLPSDYRDRQYVVDDWRGYDLQAPPRGYHWVGVNGDYLLVAITSGVISQIITGR